MPPQSYESSSAELAAEGHNLHVPRRSLRLMESNEDNIGFGVEYTPDFLQLMMLAYKDEDGFIPPDDEANLNKLFRERMAWKLGTNFRSVFCAITVLAVGQRSKDGWSFLELDQYNKKRDDPNINVFALLFQVGIALTAFALQSNGASCCVLILSLLLPQGVEGAPTDQDSADRCLSQMYWRKDIDFELYKVRQTAEFKAVQATLTGAKLAEYGMIPARLHADTNFEKWVGLGIAICTAARVHRDGLSPADALHAVVVSGGLKADFFGTP